MQDLVSRSVLMQMAKEEGVYPSDKEVEDEITFQKNLDPNFLPNYTRRGLTPIQIRDEVRFRLVQEKLITKGITVTDEEVETWLKRNPKAFINPASVELSWILATTENRKQQADEALKSGQKFQDVAVKLSQAPSAPMMQGRYLPEKGPLPIDALAPTLKPAVESGSEGTETNWIKFTEGWAKFHIDKKNKESNIELTDTRKANVKRNLAIQRGNKANDLRKRLVSKIQTADIVIRRESLKEPWKNFETLLKKQAEQAAAASQPVASPNTTGGTGGGETVVPSK